MAKRRLDRSSGWLFSVRTTAYFVIVAALCLGALSLLGLRQIKAANEVNSAIRIERAGRAATALLEERIGDATVTSNPAGSPRAIVIDSPTPLAPDPSWDDLLDAIGGVNQGAANLFRFNADTQSFDRLSTTFRKPDGTRAGGSQVEPGLISAGHPAFASLAAGLPFIGEVPVAGRLRLAYLTPITAGDDSLTGILAVDVGWVDDLNRINDEASDRALAAMLILLAALTISCILVMFVSFRPLLRLTEIAHALGSKGGDRTIELTDRRDEIGYLAKGLAKVAELQQTLEHRAYNDSLTAIPNRAALMLELDERFEAVTREDPMSCAFALLIIDLDGFKEVNDGLGHHAGDELLVGLATSLRRSLQPGEFLARLGGDEFAIISAIDPDIATTVDELAQRARTSAAGVFQTSAGDAWVTASVGIALIPEHGVTTSQAMRNADLALYEVKRAGRGSAMLYESNLSVSFQRRMYLVSELRRALDNQALRVEYQPLYDKVGHLSGLEGLARWTHESGDAISPAEFIPIAENVGLIDQLGGWVLEESCRQISEWVRNHDDVPTVSVNVSSLQLRNKDFVNSVRDLLNRYPAARGRLCFELTESVLVPRNNDLRRNVLAALSDMGVSLAIDDFGTGSSSLNYLHELVVDQVKIDRTFVVSAVEDKKQAQLLAGIVGLGKNLGLSVVLEGVETDLEFALAQDLDCDLVQGYLLGKAMPAGVVSKYFGVTHPHFDNVTDLAA
ncbi:MAG: diguanylate cyclase (GGDEF)-like protein [Verrucomicrobiales bacterium]|jgi:diguanylate cyclase (GGDEF)-like protein